MRREAENTLAHAFCTSEFKAFDRYASFVDSTALQHNLSSCGAFAAIAAATIIAAASASTAAIMSQPQAPRGVREQRRRGPAVRQLVLQGGQRVIAGQPVRPLPQKSPEEVQQAFAAGMQENHDI